MHKTSIFIIITLSLAYSITMPGTGSDVDPTLEPTVKITQAFTGTNNSMKLIYNGKGKYLTE